MFLLQLNTIPHAFLTLDMAAFSCLSSADQWSVANLQLSLFGLILRLGNLYLFRTFEFIKSILVSTRINRLISSVPIVLKVDAKYSTLKTPNLFVVLLINEKVKMSFSLNVKCWTDRQASEWKAAIKECHEKHSAGLTDHQIRFSSFAPQRKDSLAHWYVSNSRLNSPN